MKKPSARIERKIERRRKSVEEARVQLHPLEIIVRLDHPDQLLHHHHDHQHGMTEKKTKKWRRRRRRQC